MNKDTKKENNKQEETGDNQYQEQVIETHKKRFTYDGDGLFWGIVLITGGLLFLLNNFGLLSWDVWDTIWRFWPLFLVIIGLQIIIGKSLVAKIIIGFITLILIWFILLYSVSQVNPVINKWVQKSFPWFPVSVNKIIPVK